MTEHGHEISNHGWLHKQLSKCTPEEMLYEIEHNDGIIEAKIGLKPITFSYPDNSKNGAVILETSKNHVGARIEQFQMEASPHLKY